MLISTKGRYALRVMIDLAEHQADGFIPLKVIAQRQEISEKYLENIIKLLVKAKLLTGVRERAAAISWQRRPSSTRWRASCASRRILSPLFPAWIPARMLALTPPNAARFPCGGAWISLLRNTLRISPWRI